MRTTQNNLALADTVTADVEVDSPQRYLELLDLVDGLVAAFENSYDDGEDADLLTTLADATQELAVLSVQVHSTVTETELIRADRDDARFAQLFADIACARADGQARTATFPELEAHPYVRAMLAQMAGQGEQPGWILALRLNVLIDHALFAGIHTGLAQRLALAATRRPDGLDAEEHEAADAEEDEAVVADAAVAAAA